MITLRVVPVWAVQDVDDSASRWRVEADPDNEDQIIEARLVGEAFRHRCLNFHGTLPTVCKR